MLLSVEMIRRANSRPVVTNEIKAVRTRDSNICEVDVRRFTEKALSVKVERDCHFREFQSSP